MNRTGDVTASYLVQVVPKETAVVWAEQRYRSEIELILVELHTLLPRYLNCVDPGRYACDRDELLALTVDYWDTSSNLGELVGLLGEAKRQRQVFIDVLGVLPALGFVGNDLLS